ncbi:MAG: c-type cytochrome [Lysobacterales bacterium]
MPFPLLLGAVLLAASPTMTVRPAKLGLCVACHGENGVAVTPDAPHLAAQRESYLVAALTAYRSGARKHAAMQAVAGTLSPRDIADCARWYAAQRPVRAP